ncbi:hypothetical protein P152DRAFT_456813 [Eremomyces bilateralis CBS 781.70]|uniref:Uncharacterized protein n=1 Tax=Eremomyces bilateralis CBS 781.70 TaxID=1392243 RepID=A0A6G1G917_9PEZI|nr:uncharacterized protein P152DRAFT_456813 [Eremomyces bilateralis CBS 781.70]KAF1814544.1 hypothetical protein P152DRAFT_456813 [Eremomyces bilateralis CBS 781.70]
MAIDRHIPVINCPGGPAKVTSEISRLYSVLVLSARDAANLWPRQLVWNSANRSATIKQGSGRPNVQADFMAVRHSDIYLWICLAVALYLFNMSYCRSSSLSF